MCTPRSAPVLLACNFLVVYFSIYVHTTNVKKIYTRKVVLFFWKDKCCPVYSDFLLRVTLTLLGFVETLSTLWNSRGRERKDREDKFCRIICAAQISVVYCRVTGRLQKVGRTIVLKRFFLLWDGDGLIALFLRLLGLAGNVTFGEQGGIVSLFDVGLHVKVPEEHEQSHDEAELGVLQGWWVVTGYGYSVDGAGHNHYKLKLRKKLKDKVLCKGVPSPMNKLHFNEIQFDLKRPTSTNLDLIHN